MNRVYNTESHTNLVDTLEEMADIIRNRQKQATVIVDDVQVWSYRGQWFASVYFEDGIDESGPHVSVDG